MPIGQQQADSILSGSETKNPIWDGERLYTQVYTPKQAGEPLPIILLRTPYGHRTGQPRAWRVRWSISLPTATSSS